MKLFSLSVATHISAMESEDEDYEAKIAKIREITLNQDNEEDELIEDDEWATASEKNQSHPAPKKKWDPSLPIEAIEGWSYDELAAIDSDDLLEQLDQLPREIGVKKRTKHVIGA
ncbi:hypothetical protein BY458DRAFT_492136 [Sporodiniella umbellata]|nr:hypothetical protein BY458DRAFT_492136 [Sporodiniella umbellata]